MCFLYTSCHISQFKLGWIQGLQCPRCWIWKSNLKVVRETDNWVWCLTQPGTAHDRRLLTSYASLWSQNCNSFFPWALEYMLSQGVEKCLIIPAMASLINHLSVMWSFSTKFSLIPHIMGSNFFSYFQAIGVESTLTVALFLLCTERDIFFSQNKIKHLLDILEMVTIVNFISPVICMASGP